MKWSFGVERAMPHPWSVKDQVGWGLVRDVPAHGLDYLVFAGPFPPKPSCDSLITGFSWTYFTLVFKMTLVRAEGASLMVPWLSRQVGWRRLARLVLPAARLPCHTSHPLHCFDTEAEPGEGNFSCSPVAELLAASAWVFLQVFLPNPVPNTVPLVANFPTTRLTKKKLTVLFTLSKLESHRVFLKLCLF